MNSIPSFSVIVPTCDRVAVLARCLERLTPECQSLSGKSYEVIVTDDGSDSATKVLIAERFPGVYWTQGPRRGPAANRNHGAELARGEWFMFVDDDCLPNPDWLAAFDRAITGSPNRRALEGRVYVKRAREHPLEFSPINETGGMFWSCNVALRRDVFKAVTGFDERFPFNAMEDMDLRLRLCERGFEIAFVPDAAVEHPWRRIENWEQHFVRHLQSRMIYEELHPGAGLFSLSQFLRVHAKIVAREQLPWLLRKPLVMLRHLPVLWKTMLIEFYVTWRRRAPAVLDRWLH